MRPNRTRSGTATQRANLRFPRLGHYWSTAPAGTIHPTGTTARLWPDLLPRPVTWGIGACYIRSADLWPLWLRLWPIPWRRRRPGTGTRQREATQGPPRRGAARVGRVCWAAIIKVGSAPAMPRRQQRLWRVEIRRCQRGDNWARVTAGAGAAGGTTVPLEYVGQTRASFMKGAVGDLYAGRDGQVTECREGSPEMGERLETWRARSRANCSRAANGYRTCRQTRSRPPGRAGRDTGGAVGAGAASRPATRRRRRACRSRPKPVPRRRGAIRAPSTRDRAPAVQRPTAQRPRPRSGPLPHCPPIWATTPKLTGNWRSAAIGDFANRTAIDVAVHRIRFSNDQGSRIRGAPAAISRAGSYGGGYSGSYGGGYSRRRELRGRRGHARRTEFGGRGGGGRTALDALLADAEPLIGEPGVAWVTGALRSIRPQRCAACSCGGVPTLAV